MSLANAIVASKNIIENKTGAQLKVMLVYTKVGQDTPDKCETKTLSLSPYASGEFNAISPNCIIRTIDIRSDDGKKISETLSTPPQRTMKITITMDGQGRLQMLFSY